MNINETTNENRIVSLTRNVTVEDTTVVIKVRAISEEDGYSTVTASVKPIFTPEEGNLLPGHDFDVWTVKNDNLDEVAEKALEGSMWFATWKAEKLAAHRNGTGHWTSEDRDRDADTETVEEPENRSENWVTLTGSVTVVKTPYVTATVTATTDVRWDDEKGHAIVFIKTYPILEFNERGFVAQINADDWTVKNSNLDEVAEEAMAIALDWAKDEAEYLASIRNGY